MNVRRCVHQVEAETTDPPERDMRGKVRKMDRGRQLLPRPLQHALLPGLQDEVEERQRTAHRRVQDRRDRRVVVRLIARQRSGQRTVAVVVAEQPGADVAAQLVQVAEDEAHQRGLRRVDVQVVADLVEQRVSDGRIACKMVGGRRSGPMEAALRVGRVAVAYQRFEGVSCALKARARELRRPLLLPQSQSGAEQREAVLREVRGHRIAQRRRVVR